jgi:streptogramin lyase
MRPVLLALVLAGTAAGAPPGQIETIVGTGRPGYSGDGGPALRAELNAPFHCDVGDGDLYIAEAFNHCIRKVSLKTNIITTVAGTGQKGYTGDGSPATQATFNEPYAVVVSDDGDLFIVDRLNAVVRRVKARTGVITTVAGCGRKGYGGDGGPATAALLTEPNDCILDGKGGLLIADVGDWRIRRLDLATGVITTFAGTGRVRGKVDRGHIGDGGPATQAVLPGARAVCVDGKGNTYICEREGNAVRKVDAKGIITTIAGTGAKGYSGDGGDARQATFNGPKGIRCDAKGNIYVVDAENNAIRVIRAQTNVVTTLAGGCRGSGGDGGDATKAGLAQPHGCIVPFLDVLFIADTSNHRVRKVTLPPAVGTNIVFRETFEHGAGQWQPTDSKVWRVVRTKDGSVYSQFRQSDYKPPYRSPFNFSLLKDHAFTDFTLDVKVRSTVKDYPHRDVCLIFGYQDPAHFYYVHLGKRTDDHSNQIFIVNGAPRTKISTKTTPVTNWDDGWHRVRILRKTLEGTIEVYFDDLEKPVMTAKDKTFTWGQIGLGSFDDTGDWSDVSINGTLRGEE